MFSGSMGERGQLFLGPGAGLGSVVLTVAYTYLLSGVYCHIITRHYNLLHLHKMMSSFDSIYDGNKIISRNTLKKV